MDGLLARELRRSLGAAVTALALAVCVVGPALAHGGGLGDAAASTVSVPTWLVLVTGGAAVGASFLLSTFVTDRAFLRRLEAWRLGLPSPGRATRAILAIVGVGGLIGILVVGILGPPTETNAAVLVVWAGWWAGFTMTTYLLGNAWPALNPWRAIARNLPALERGYPDWLGAWPAVVGLLGLVWIEIANPLASDPGLLAGLVLAYTVVTLAGAITVGHWVWFDRVDPIARVFRWYGRLAPVGREGDGGIALRLPGSGLRAVADDASTDGEGADRRDLLSVPGGVAFAVALLWVTTFDGLVATPGWRFVAETLTGLGIPGPALYPLGMGLGFLAFLGIYRLAARLASRRVGTADSPAAIGRAFAPSLVPIAAGYHLAHFLGYFLSLAPATVAAAMAPGTNLTVLPTLPLPGWFEGVALAAVLLGHVLAIWVAHGTAFARFPDRMRAIRSQYPLVAVMVFYTATSLWIVSQ